MNSVRLIRSFLFSNGADAPVRRIREKYSSLRKTARSWTDLSHRGARDSRAGLELVFERSTKLLGTNVDSRRSDEPVGHTTCIRETACDRSRLVDACGH